jgi:O-succinylbenzoate synthase
MVSVELRMIRLPLVRPFRTSFGTENDKQAIIVKVETDSGIGWGECVAGPDPGYSEEFNEGAWVVLREFLVPALMARSRADSLAPQDVAATLSGIRGNRMAKAALEGAYLDATLRAQGESLSVFLGGTREAVDCGVSIGIPPSTADLLDQVEQHLDEGYQRVKLKIAPGFDVEPVSAVRAANPDTLLSVDANAAYGPADEGIFRELDRLDLLMIEQPYSNEDLLEHSKLQAVLDTAICLDESIRSASDARAAIELGSCKIINIKPGRVGGLFEAVRIHAVARERNIPVWCGGMLETGIGRAGNLALASLPGFTLPGDIGASARYFPEDLTEPFVLESGGRITVPRGPGIGVVPDPERLDAATMRVERIEHREKK